MNNMEQSKTNKTNTEEIKQKTPEPQESKKEISVESIDEALITEEGILDSLNKYSKDEFFKDIDLKNNLKFKGVGVVDEKFDEAVYGKATVSEKILNFATLGLAKKDLGFIKSKERGLLNKEMEGKEIEIGQNTEERSGMEKIIGNMHKELSEEDLGGRRITKSFEFVDGKIIKIVQASRTEQGQIEAVVKLKDEKIKEADILGSDLIKSKEQLEKHLNDKDKLENLKYLSAEGKEDLRKHMAEEQSDLDALIKDKKQELEDKLSIFKKPLEERVNQTGELLNKVSGAFEFVKKEETETSKKLKEIDSEIKLIEQSGILEGRKNQIIESLKAGKNEMANNLNEIALRKKALENRLSILKINKQDLDKELSKINKIGKTKEEITEEERKKNEGKKDKREDDKKEADKPQSSDFTEDRGFMKGRKDVKTKPKEDLKGGV